MLQTLRAFVDVVLAVAVQSLMLAQVSFGYWRLRRRAVLEPSVATLDKRLRRRPLPAEAVDSHHADQSAVDEQSQLTHRRVQH